MRKLSYEESDLRPKKTENDFIEKVNVRPEGISVAQTF